MLVMPIVPSSVIVNTGEDNEPYQVAEDFFASILSFLGYNEEAAACFAQREDRELVKFGPGQPIRTDSKISLLVIKDRLVASVLYWRNDANYIQVVYAHYLSQELIENIRCPAF